ncbi:hypothetical protein ACFV30_34145 [Streptomyces sp. NPDC059752]|uniref:hypothetical protein n=1 Tax=unclassified Streptomyces TaxID=2593676 RepID=UPI00364BF498
MDVGRALDAAQGVAISGPLVAAVLLGTLVTALAAWWDGGRTASALASTGRPKAY